MERRRSRDGSTDWEEKGEPECVRLGARLELGRREADAKISLRNQTWSSPAQLPVTSQLTPASGWQPQRGAIAGIRPSSSDGQVRSTGSHRLRRKDTLDSRPPELEADTLLY